MSDEPLEVARFYRITKYPKVVGRFYDGSKIPGGPYTMTQGVVGTLALFLMLQTSFLWARGNILLDLPLGAFVVYGSAWVAGHISVGNRNPVVLLAGLFRAVTSPSQGQYNERPFRSAVPHQVIGRVITDLPSSSAPESCMTKPPQTRAKRTASYRGDPNNTPQLALAEEPRAATAIEYLLAQSNLK